MHDYIGLMFLFGTQERDNIYKGNRITCMQDHGFRDRPYLFAQLGCLRETPDDWDFKIRRQISHKLGEVFPPRLQHNHRHVIFHDVGAERFRNLLK